MAEPSGQGLAETLGEAIERLGVADTLAELRKELGSLGREVAAAGRAAAVRAGADFPDEPADAAASEEDEDFPRDADDDFAEAAGSPAAGARRRRVRRRTLRGSRARLAGVDAAAEAAEPVAPSAPEVDAATLAALGASVEALAERLERTCGLVDAVADLVEEQSERLVTVEELLEALLAENREGSGENRLRTTAWAAPEPGGLLLVDPDGVRAAMLAGQLRARGVRTCVAEPDGGRPGEADGFALALHADVNVSIAIRLAGAAEPRPGAVPRPHVIVYSMAGESDAAPARRAAALSARLGACPTAVCGEDGEELVRLFAEACRPAP